MRFRISLLLITMISGISCSSGGGDNNSDSGNINPADESIVPTGSLDVTFGAAGFLTEGGEGRQGGMVVKVDSAGKILIVGVRGEPLLTGGRFLLMAVWRYNADGTIDTSFNSQGYLTYNSRIGTGHTSEGYDIAIDNNGKILLTGYDEPFGSTASMILARFNEDGTFDTSFNTTGIVNRANSSGGGVTIDDNSRILVTGFESNGAMMLIRYNSDGTIDNTFGTNGVTNSLQGIATQVAHYNGKIYVVGATGSGTTLWRFNEDGSLDTSFATNGMVFYTEGTSRPFIEYKSSYLAIDQNGKIVVSAQTGTPEAMDRALLRYNTDGTLDTTFGDAGIISYDSSLNDYGGGVTIDANNNVIVTYSTNSTSGTIGDMIIRRYTSAGQLDMTFGVNGEVTYDSGGVDGGKGVTVDNNGRILITGKIGSDMALWRYE